ncbi:hypothetical protein B6U83_00120 [Thermoplasmatales archaeon ex4484_36]|nr:MAG: hypothetical protein B6U83_00120 [Thermoplasmatales archaeon ex4484_36]
MISARDADFVEGPVPWEGDMEFGQTVDFWAYVEGITALPESSAVPFIIHTRLMNGDERDVECFLKHPIKQIFERAHLSIEKYNRKALGWIDASILYGLDVDERQYLLDLAVERLMDLGRDLFRFRCNMEGYPFAAVTEDFVPVLAERLDTNVFGLPVVESLRPSDGFHGGIKRVRVEEDMIQGVVSASMTINCGMLDGAQSLSAYVLMSLPGDETIYSTSHNLLDRVVARREKRIHKGTPEEIVEEAIEHANVIMTRLEYADKKIVHPGDVVAMLYDLIRRRVISERTALLVVSVLNGRPMKRLTIDKRLSLFRLSGAFAFVARNYGLKTGPTEALVNLSSSVLDIVYDWDRLAKEWIKKAKPELMN